MQLPCTTTKKTCKVNSPYDRGNNIYVCDCVCVICSLYPW